MSKESKVTDIQRLDAAVKLLKHHDYDNIAEAVERLQQQNKRLIEAFKEIESDLISHKTEWAMIRVRETLQQIQGKEDER